ncbi:class I SAM-dependent methyltransferase [Thiohalocapsa marina]|uniref:Class I SAM-dependent methyltransferase n=1 Tax=Thiohalocapsa marina TaxID=424902 RepID=A0A5M8FJG6_9GAMM|nr:class I SAM-dependent methyltransferase [Thiohalocapsa marina]KAA6184827.1 class I SAM-dependent methyltransferase [Thiohalocapsa marina]
MDINYKKKIVDGHEVCFASEWVYELEDEIHFNWYYHQAELVYRHLRRDQMLLEIGLGTGLLSDLLRRRKWNITTLDIDEDKKPDFCENAIDFDYRKHHVEVVLAFEIFEHIPFSTLKKLVEKLSRSEVTTICFSLPWCERELLSLAVKLPRLSKMKWSLRIPRKGISTKAHFWELSLIERPLGGKQLISLSRVMQLFMDHGYTVDPGKKVGYIQYFTASRLNLAQ